MPPPSDRPIRRVNLFLFEDNIAELQRRIGTGWTTEIRNIVDRHMRRKLQEESNDRS